MRAADPAEVAFAVARVWVTDTGGQAMIRIGPVERSCCWFVQRIGHRFTGFWIAGDERAACTAVESWMRRRRSMIRVGRTHIIAGAAIMPRMIPAESPEEIDRQTQLLRGALDMCLLALLGREPAHGYELVRRMADAGFGAVGYGTIYPLLTRMRRLGLVADEQVASPAGPPRKVYALTAAGRDRLAAWERQWSGFARTVDAILTSPSPDPLRS
jgi:PadR family transcriptional regulator PadR